ncbi:MBL fold metallo-hydrolase [Faecalicatena contorta]|uniref:Ribonuclease Z n=1 Tax=Faecalicatena contorta TaxID=39482 RepID=A0A315ZQV5_9FIRM|nr:MBL fold metallo-hydrolase [Faecalicatena contorta]PWJ47689.1 ribonuclease Z [Faecalicatena contorta]SUQ15882.1 ribonuclease Z [Faecalicatena contorta]
MNNKYHIVKKRGQSDEDRSIRMIVLGTGTAIVKKYYNTSFLLDDGSKYFLVDGGGGDGILHQFSNLNLDFAKLHHAFLSHEHTDHLLGMVWVLRYTAYLMGRGEYEGDFFMYGHDVVCEKVKLICQMLLQPAEYAMFDDRIHMVVVEDGQEMDVLDYHITYFDIHSTKARQFGFSMCYKEGKTLVFLGDEPLASGCEMYAEGAEWMLSEAFCLYAERDYYNPYQYHHATVREGAENANRYHVKNLILWHTEDETTYGRRKELYTAEAAKYFKGNVWVPDDGDILEL